MNPYLWAIVASIGFGAVVFLWQETLRTVGLAGFLMAAGTVYFLTGIGVYLYMGTPEQPSFSTAALALFTGAIYATILVICSHVFTRPGINIPAAVTITAAYPAWTALITLVWFRQSMPAGMWLFTIMIMVGIVGLSLNSKPAN
jgi:hypothetical protein